MPVRCQVADRAGILELYGVDEVATVAREPVARDRRPVARGPWPAARGRRPAARGRGRRPVTRGRHPWPVARDRRPVAGDPRPAAGDPWPVPVTRGSLPSTRGRGRDRMPDVGTVDWFGVGFSCARREPVRRLENGTSHGLRHGGA
jgi:hypothetical protein